MLDDLKLIHQKDPEDSLGFAMRQHEQLLTAFELPKKIGEGVRNVVLAGMGGSGFNARMVRTWPGVRVPFELIQDYDLPAYVGPETLVIASSFSGNTEETLAALEQAEARGAQIAIIAASGKLKKIAAAKKYPFAELPNLPQPRFAVFSSFRALVEVLARAGLVDKGYEPALARAAAFVEEAVQAWAPEVPSARNQAKQLARELLGESVVIYAGPKLFPAAYKWKIGCNENAKQVAWCNQLPEFNHNEFIGWSGQPVDKPYAVVDLRSSFEHKRTQRRFEVTERLLSGLRPAPLVVQAEGETELEQMLWAMALGDFVSLYLALLNGVNPAPVELVEKFKKALDK